VVAGRGWWGARPGRPPGVAPAAAPTLPAQVRQPRPGVLEITLREGRKRQVRRMCEAVGHPVIALERIAFGPLKLSGLKRGAHRRLTPQEVALLRQQ
jgi:23S rRNA pseudouridine2605 synthase